ncbi:MAG: IS4 family transposase [Bacteroidota bacterium]
MVGGIRVFLKAKISVSIVQKHHINDLRYEIFKKILTELSVFTTLLKIFNYHKLDQLAREVGFIQRRRKFRAVDLVRICVFWDGRGSYPTLERLVDKLRQSRVFLCKESLNQRFNSKSVRYLRKLAGLVLSLKLKENLKLDWSRDFGRIIVLDSTVGQLFNRCKKKFPGFEGGASSAAFKVQYCFDLLSGNLRKLTLGAGRRADGGFRLRGIRRKDFWLFDLGYVHMINLKKLTKSKASFLCRFKYTTAVYQINEFGFEQLDLSRLIQQMKVGEICDTNVYIGHHHKFPVRMIIEKLPEKISAEIRRKIKSDKQNKRKNISQGRLNFCDVNAYITNLEPEKLPPRTARKIYSLRWQIEIVFKIWKSVFDLDKVPRIKTERFECFFWGCLIRVTIAMKFFWLIKVKAWNLYQTEISEIKALGILAQRTHQICDLILDRRASMTKFIREIWYSITQNARKDRKRGRLLPSDFMMNPCLT